MDTYAYIFVIRVCAEEDHTQTHITQHKALVSFQEIFTAFIQKKKNLTFELAHKDFQFQVRH